jgi:tRNA-dihydrouridine synthase 1
LKKIQLIMADEAKRKREDNDNGEEKSEGTLSKNKMKKLARLARNPKKQALLAKQAAFLTCNQCSNLPVIIRFSSTHKYSAITICFSQGVKCEHKLCRTCCKKKCETENLTCEGHTGTTVKRREKNLNGELKLTEEKNISNDVSNSPTSVLV